MRQHLKVFFSAAAILYPFIIFILLVVLKVPVRVLSFCVMALALASFLSATAGKNKANLLHLGAATIFMIAGLLCFFTNRTVFLKFYPVSVSTVFLVSFGTTLFFGPSMVFRFACIQDKTIKGSWKEKKICAYCKKVTEAWCVFFICNGTIAVYTALFCSDTIWSIYNGGISYILMGLMFATELLVRRRFEKNMFNIQPISKFTAASRPDDYVLCYEDVWSKGGYKTWLDFLTDTARVRAFINRSGLPKWILHCDDYWYFLVAFTALLQCNKEVLLTQNTAASFITEIKTNETGFLTDIDMKDAASVPKILTESCTPKEMEIRSTPEINADLTHILMYTSGSTGHPKAVLQRMTEFELDNAFVISKWGKEFAKRKLVATVSQHHIYGFLFGVSLPFTLGVPFRRKRIEFPEEFEKLSDTSYIIIAVPAFLKRAVETEEKLPLKDTFIFTSGGVLSPDTAKKTCEVFGFWPIEVYGSTETSGIAWRQSKNGMSWMPFDNAKLSLNGKGCLVIRSPYIKDPAGFETADLAEFTANGRFLLKGRSDSVVKIEEKRISLTEVENRLLETGIVQDVKVIAMSGKRQYLAAAIVLNDRGKRKFCGAKKLEINKYFHEYLLAYFENVVLPKRWRYLEALPIDAQGKKQKEAIMALFKDNVSE